MRIALLLAGLGAAFLPACADFPQGEGRIPGVVETGVRPELVREGYLFSGPGKRVLYITAQEGLYRLPTLAQGPMRLGK